MPLGNVHRSRLDLSSLHMRAVMSEAPRGRGLIPEQEAPQSVLVLGLVPGLGLSLVLQETP